jgi:membrane protein DedA with SNARE-associated domain
MGWYFVLVFVCAMAVDIVPLPLPPAFTVMIFLQLKYDLNIWDVILVGVAGSILGRFILTLYISKVSNKIFNRAKNEDIQFLGEKLKTKGWKSQASILFYTLMPLPSTPLFLAAGMAKMKPFYIIPAFTLGKIVSDTIAVHMGKYAADNTAELIAGMFSWKSISGVLLGLILVFALLFIDWRTLIQQKKIKLKFNIWN